MSSYYKPNHEVSVTANHLPHWHQDETLCFITWRMGDSLPKSKLDAWAAKRKAWLQAHPKPWTEDQQQEHHEFFHRTIDQWLDAGAGSCILAQSRCRHIVTEALFHRDGQQFTLIAFVIMPNHVHLLIKLDHSEQLPKIMQSLKRHTARQINLLLGREGKFWQADYYDTLIRSPQHLAHVRRYLHNNPKHLKPHQFTLWEQNSFSDMK